MVDKAVVAKIGQRALGVGLGDRRFRKEDRLRQRRQFLAVQQQGRKFPVRDLIGFALPQSGPPQSGPPQSGPPQQGQPQQGQGRLGITVSSKVGGAVTRNRVKRMIREAWRQHKDLFPSGLDLVVIAKHSAAEAASRQVERQVCQLAEKLRRWHRDVSLNVSQRASGAEGPGRAEGCP